MVSTRRQASVEPPAVRTQSVDSAQQQAPSTAGTPSQPRATRGSRSTGAKAGEGTTPSSTSKSARGSRLPQVAEDRVLDTSAAGADAEAAAPVPAPSASGSDRSKRGAAAVASRSSRGKAASKAPLSPLQEATSPHHEVDVLAEAPEVAQPAAVTKVAAQAAPAVAAAEDADESSDALSSSSSDKDESDDDNILGAGPLAQLADSLRAAFSARVGQIADADEDASEDDDGPADQQQKKPKASALHWQHDVSVPKVKKHSRAAGPVASEKEAGLSKQLVVPPRDPSIAAKAAAKAKPDTAGSRWFDLPATPITDDVKLQLRLLRLRGAYDPRRFYKSFDNTKFPKHFHIGTVLDNPTDFYSSRLENKQRGETLTQELMKDEGIKHSRKRRFNKLQEQAQAHLRVKKRKTDNARINKKKPRPKH